MNQVLAGTVGEIGVDSPEAVWERAVARREKLEGMFRDDVYLDRLLTDGRYFKLCAAFACASANEERARADLETDAMVRGLRAARSGAVEK